MIVHGDEKDASDFELQSMITDDILLICQKDTDAKLGINPEDNERYADIVNFFADCAKQELIRIDVEDLRINFNNINTNAVTDFKMVKITSFEALKAIDETYFPRNEFGDILYKGEWSLLTDMDILNKMDGINSFLPTLDNGWTSMLDLKEVSTISLLD